MKRRKTNYTATIEDGQSSSELLILPDGRILAHNISPAMALVLAELDPSNIGMRLRANSLVTQGNYEPATGN